ncbi:MAG: hypothetical protein ABI317_13270 [Gaiellales bacterium]
MSSDLLEDSSHETLGDPEWPSQVHAHSVRLRPLTALLGIVLVAVAGIWGGAELEKRHGASSSSSSTGLAALASRFGRTGGGFAGGGFAGGGAAAGGATTGIVTEVTKKLLYLTSSTGALIKVSLTSKTTFTRTASSPKGGLALGDSAIVIGAKNAAGTVVATSVIATQKGVTATRGGFGSDSGSP